MNTKYARTHHSLIETGMKLFSANGFDNISILDICKQLNISRPTFYLHFKTKEHLISEYYESCEFLSKEMEEWIHSASDPWNALIRLQMAYIQHIYDSDNVDLVAHYLSFRLTSRDRAETPDFNNILEEQMVSLIRKAQEDGMIGNQSDAFHLCNSIIMLHNGNLLDWCSSNGHTDYCSVFFWNMESILEVKEEYRGVWKLNENIPTFSL